MRYFRTTTTLTALLLATITSPAAIALTEQELCAIEKAEAAAAYVSCLSNARIAGINDQLSDEEIARLSLQCEAKIIENADAASFAPWQPCDGQIDVLPAGQQNSPVGGHDPRLAVRPQIPKQNFEWTGTFVGNALKLTDPQLRTNLTIRGKWQDGYFNLYMEQGHEGSGLWVENILYQNKLYTITHEWHTDLPEIIKGNCFENTLHNPGKPLQPLPITVDDLNGILSSSRLVGFEIVEGLPMNHFRTTCLSKAGIPDFPWIAPFVDIKIFSDIYVPPGHAFRWLKWLQFGDGVGPDPQNDEWFLFNRWSAYPDDIILPVQCNFWNSIKVQQAPCSNLVEKL